MIGEIKKDITDDDIDDLFNNNNVDVLKKIDSKVEIPKELSVDSKENVVQRPKQVPLEENRVRNEIKKLESDVDSKIENDINSVRDIYTLEQAKKYIKKLIQLQNRSRENEQKTKMIIKEVIPSNVDPGTECTFHLYRPRHIMGDDIECQCEYCSCYKKFTQKEWDEYCIKYRKWF